MASRVSGYSLNKRLKENQAKRQSQTRSRVSGYSKYGTSYNAKNSGSTLGYLGGSLVAGIGGIGEGIVDLTAAAGALLVGDKEYAKYVFKDNVVGDWHQSLTENYNPGAIMGFMGNVAHSMGQSSVMLLDAVGVPVGSVAFYGGMIGQGISNAAEKTGDVGFKEVAYGASVGVAEGILETYLGGAGKAVKNIVGSTFKNVGKNAVRKGLLREILSDAGQEFAEEFASEYVDVFLQRVTGVDKDASTTIKDAAYSGLVGFFSGAMSAGTSDVIRYAATKQKGAQIIASGNAETLVRTAEMMADKLAGQGTNFKNTAEWIRNLRADVDAYNKLNAEQKVGAKGQAILGELHAVVGMSELQTILGGVQEKIQNESFENREMLAEYINQSVDKSKRKKDYTAEDVSDNTDNIATQLAVLRAVGLVDLDGAIADAMRESAITNVINEERAAAAEDTEEAVPGEAGVSNNGGLLPNNEGVLPNSAEVSGIVPETGAEAANGEVEDEIVIDMPYEGEIEDEIVIDMPYEGELDDEGGMYAEGTQYSLSTAKAARKRAQQNKARAEREKAKILAQEARKDSEEQTFADDVESKAETEEATESGAKRREDDSPKETAEAVAENATTKADEKADESGEAEPKINEAKEILTIEQKRERAKERARKWVEWEKRTAPKVAELNAAREAVKGFDDLDITRRLAIVRMIRSALESGTKVDAKMLKGVANLMAAKTKNGRYFAGDLEVRFAEGIGSRGLHTTVGGKHLILLDPSVKYAETIKGTVAHEIVHYLENRAGYAQLAEFAKKHAKQGSIDEIRAKYDTFYNDMYTAEEQEKGGSEEEIAARVRERMESEEYKSLIDSEIVASLVGEGLKNERFLKRYAEKDDKLIRRVWNWLKGLKASLKDRDREAEKIVDEMAFRMDMALQSGVVRESKSGVKHSFSSIAYSFFGDEEIGVEKLEDLSYKKTQGYKDYVEQCLSNMRQSRSEFNEAVARKEIEDGIDGIVRVAVAAKKAGYDIYDSAAQRNTRDSKKRLLFSSLEPNSDYFTSSDISTICDKRKNFTEIEAEINRIEAERGVPREKRFFSDINNYFVLHEILAKHGLTTACRQCYVESMRKNFGRMANAFIDLVTEEDGGNKKNRQLYSPKGELKSGNAEMRERVRALIAEESIPDKYLTFEALTSGEMLAEIRLQHPLLFEAYNSFYGQSKPKMPKAATPFRFGELTALLTDDKGKINKGLVKRIESTGGFRLQSYSDFQIKNYVDVLQVIFEAGTLGLSGHAYTKVPAFLDATAGTNLKRNISIFMYRDGDEWKIDRSDSFPYALDKIYDIVNADKSGDTGIIAVSQNEDMSAYIMANDLIAYGIPFHKSGTKMAVVRETVVREGGREIKGYLGIKDHTRMQSEVYASGENKGKKVKAPINIYSFWDFDNKRMSKKNLIEKNLKAYIDACEEAGYLPKFREYVMNNEKVLSATLSYAKKLGFVGADATIADISFKYKGYVIPYGYYKFLGDFSMFTPDGKASPHEVLSLKGYDFDKAVAFFADSKKLRTNELLQQIDNGPEREKYRKMIESGEMTIAQLGKVIKDKRDEVVAEVVGEKPVVKRDLDPDKKYRAAKKAEPKGKDVYFENAELKGSNRDLTQKLEESKAETKKARNEAEAFKKGNKILNQKLVATRAESARYKAEAKSLARQIAQDAYETDAKTFTQKEVEALIERINEYSTDKFKDVMNEKSAKISKADKEQFAFDIYVAFHVASADKRAIERINVLADKLARQYLDNVYYSEDGSRVYLNEILDEATYNEYVNTFRKKIMASFKSMGRETTHARLTAIYRAEMAKLKKQMLDAEAEGKNLRELQYQAKQLRTTVDIQKRSPQDEGIYNVEKEMSRIADERGRINAKQADKAFDQMHLFLTSDSGKMDTALEEMAQVEGESMIELIEEYKHSREQSRSKYLSSKEMELAAKIIAGGRKILREYNRVFYNGHWEDMGKLAGETVTDILSFSGAEKEYKTKIGKFLGEKVGKGIQQVYFYKILSPENVVEALEGYKKNGVLKTLYHAVREATQKSEHMAVRMKKPFADYLDNKDNAWTDEDGKNHSFRDKLNQKTVKVNGNEITLGEAIYLYMLTKREHAHLGLQEAGFVTYDENNQSKLQFKILDIDRAATQIMDQLDATDKTFLNMAEKFFNETASKIKYDADMKILGYTTNQEAYYVPIIRDRYERMANVTDKRQSIGSIVTVYNKSFTQQTIKNAKALEGKNIMEIINDHADGLADYSELYLPLKSFDRIYNTRVITDTAQSTSIRKALNDKVWRNSDKYFKKLFADIQGQGEERGTLDEMVGKLRSGWVNSVLGLNLKVVATQTTSFVAANQVIEMKYLAPALAKFVGDVSELGARADEYSDIIEARNFDMGAIKAQGNIDKVARWAEKTGFMINWMDRRVCLAIFHAAELKAEAQGAGAVGTVENAKEAARIADEVIYTTQAMTSRAEKSQLQRHKSEIAKMFAMFTSDSVKQLSHLYGNVMKYIAHQERAKTDPAYETELKKDAKAMGRSATTVLMTGVMLGIITQAFKYLYAQEEEEPEEKVKDFAIDMISSTFNILPVVSDIADKFIFGYDMSLNVLDIANDTIENTSKLFSMAGKAMSGEYVSNDEVGKNLMDAVKAYGTMFGVPISPVERTITGVLRRFTPSTVYGYDAVFSNLSYTSELKAAVEKGDERLAEHVLGKLYKDEIAGVYTSEELEEVVRLYGAGYTSVLPQRIGDEVNGVKLDRKQRKQFNAIYSEASDKVTTMIRSDAFYALSDEQRAKAIKNLYTLYYSRAASEVTGKEWTNAQAYAQLISDPTVLFVAQAYKSGLEAIKNADGKEVTVKQQFVDYAKNLGLSDEAYTVIAYANGVRDKQTRADILEYINSLGLDEETKARIAERLGFTVTNGAVSEDDA